MSCNCTPCLEKKVLEKAKNRSIADSNSVLGPALASDLSTLNSSPIVTSVHNSFILVPNIPWVFSFLFLWFGVALEAALLDEDAFIRVNSRSHQFMVQMRRSGANLTDTELPSRWVVSCERIKSALLTELQMSDQWSGSIYIYIEPSDSTLTSPQLSSVKTERLGWSYHIKVPMDVDDEAFIRAITQAMIIEIANRGSFSAQSAVVPLWIQEGLTQILIHDTLTHLVVKPSKWTPASIPGASGMKFFVNPDAADPSFRKKDPLAECRRFLSQSDPLTFQDLSWPESMSTESESWNLFKYTSHLFLTELLSLENGRACIGRFLRKTSLYLNWQTAFLDAFQSHFSSVLDVEKWWTVTLVQFLTQDSFGAWTLIESMQKLESVLMCNVIETRDVYEPLGGSNPNGEAAQSIKVKSSIPVELSLQTMAHRWGVEIQRPFVEQKVQQLLALRLRAAHTLRPLLDEYLKSMQEHLETISQLDRIKSRGVDVAYSENIEANRWVKEIDGLDRTRDELNRLMEQGLLDGYSSGAMMAGGGDEIIFNFSPTPSNTDAQQNLPEQFLNSISGTKKKK